jgi:hypothetical protein
MAAKGFIEKWSWRLAMQMIFFEIFRACETNEYCTVLKVERNVLLKS